MDENVTLVAQLAQTTARLGRRRRALEKRILEKRPPLQFSLQALFICITLACVAFAILPGLVTEDWRKDLFPTHQSLWLTCGAAAFLLTVWLAVGVFLLGPSRGFLAFWFLSLASLLMIVGALLGHAPKLGAGEIKETIKFCDIVNVFCHFPVFFVPLATGCAWYLSKVYSSDDC